ncbi:MAG: GMC family oxidoreductase [Chitinophagales bacterium]|nr:GMC family oxidoreductase [Chitinophagales bacterium]
MYFNSKGNEEVTYDAIVIGSGVSGGWAAKELCEKGLKTLVLERGRMVRHGDYPTAMMEPWDFENRGQLSVEEMKDYEKQSRTGYTTRKESIHWWIKDTEHPYSEVKRFDWIRGYHVGGRSIMWGRHSYRLSDLDFEANAKDGFGVDWPIRYADIAPWYDHVEKFAGIQGQAEGLAHLPDGQFLPPIELNCVENHLRDNMKQNFNRTLTIGRTANLTQAHHGRGACQFRNRCIRGCPYGAYFSSLSSTLPAADKTGNLTIRPHSIVHSIIYDADQKKAKGVKVLDAETGESLEFYSRIVFSCASALGSTLILMNSANDIFADGLGSSSGELGHNVMDHHFRCGASGTHDGFADKYYKGRRPTGFYIARFQNIDKASESKEFLRGYGYQGGGSRRNWTRGVRELEVGLGEELKKQLIIPGPWQLGMTAFGECLPYHENKVTINRDVLDKHGMPTLTMDVEFKENEKAMRKHMQDSAAEMLEAAGFKDVNTYDAESYPGLGIHEMGTARMGNDPKTSVLNKWNQVWDAPNVFVTDGACMTSAGCQNPSLTYMALTARAANHAVEEMKKMNL